MAKAQRGDGSVLHSSDAEEARYPQGWQASLLARDPARRVHCTMMLNREVSLNGLTTMGTHAPFSSR
jgi:hypothetical protein